MSSLTWYKQACVQLPTSAVNAALPAFAAVRRAAATCSNRSTSPVPAGPTAANPPYAAAAGEWDRETD